MSLRHPILSRARYAGLYLAAMTLAGALLAPLGGVEAGPRWEPSVLLGLPLGLAAAGLGLVAWWVYGNVPARWSALPRWLATHAATALLSGFLVAVGGRAWSVALEGVGLGGSFHETRWRIVGIVLYLVAAAAHYLAHLAAAARLAENRAMSAQALARQARLKALQAQIDPHFLFNSLHSLSALCGFDPTRARRMALLLAGFFRGSVEAGRKDWLPLAEELGLMEKYLEIEKVRFEDRLEVEFEASQEVRSCLMPTFLLQPLIENAVKHGIASLVEGGTVRLAARLDDGRVEVAVENPCDPDRARPRGAGAGLANVKGRLLTLFGPAARFDVEEEPGSFRVRLAFPAREEARDG